MATDLLFPFYDILVNQLFGSIGLSIVAMAGVIVLILFLCRSGWTFITFWLMFYFLVMSIGYTGALGLVLMFIVVTAYSTYAFMRLIAASALNV